MILLRCLHCISVSTVSGTCHPIMAKKTRVSYKLSQDTMCQAVARELMWSLATANTNRQNAVLVRFHRRWTDLEKASETNEKDSKLSRTKGVLETIRNSPERYLNAITETLKAIAEADPKWKWVSLVSPTLVLALKQWFASNRKKPREVSFTDLVGIDEVKNDLNLVLSVLQGKKECKEVGLPEGLLLYGPPGTGKSTLVHALAREANVPFFPVSANDLATKDSEDGTICIKGLFTEAKRHSPSIIYIKDIDVIASKGENEKSPNFVQGKHRYREPTNIMFIDDDIIQIIFKNLAFHLAEIMENMGFCQAPFYPSTSPKQISDYISFMLHTEMDKCYDDGSGRMVAVIVATSTFDQLNPKLMTPDRFFTKLRIDKPDENSRREMAALYLKKFLQDDEREEICKAFAAKTHGLVGGDIKSISTTAKGNASQRGDTHVTMDDLRQALVKLHPNMNVENNEPVAGAANVNEPLPRAENDENEPPVAGAVNVDNEPFPGAENDENEPPVAGAANVDNEPLPGAENDENEPPASVAAGPWNLLVGAEPWNPIDKSNGSESQNIYL